MYMNLKSNWIKLNSHNNDQSDMKPRSKGFLRDELISHESEQFDYIAELHGYLWRFVRVFDPGAGGNLKDYLDKTIELAEKSDIRQRVMDLREELRVMEMSDDEYEAYQRNVYKHI